MAAQSRTRKAILLALTLLGCGLVLGGFVAMQVQIANSKIIVERLEDYAYKEVGKVELRLASYRQALFSARSFVLANNGHPSPDAFARYASFIALEREFPGMRGLGVIDRVKAADETAYVERVRQEGLNAFALRFLTPHNNDRYIIRLVEPVIANRQARGLDIGSEALRRDAADRAYTRNEAQISGPITLVQAQDKSTQAFLLMLPVFANWETPTNEADRLRSHLGWVYEPLVIQEILRGAGFDDDLFHFSITDVTDTPTKIYTCEDYSVGELPVYKAIQKEIFGRQWQFHISPTEKFIRQLDLTSPKIIFAQSAVVAVLVGLFSLAISLSLSQRRQTQRQNARLAALIEGTEDAIIEVNLEGAVTQWNRGATKMFGFSDADVIGNNLSALIVPEDLRDEVEKGMQQTVERLQTISWLTERYTSKGDLLDVMVHMSPLLGEQRTVVGVAMIIRDITKLRAAERELKEFNTKLEHRVVQRTAEVEQARDELESLVNALPDAILVMNADHLIVKANQKSTERFCSLGQSLIGLPIANVLPQEYMALLSPSLAYLTQGQLDAGEYSQVHNQTKEHFQWIIIPAISHGIYSGFYFVEQNVSTLKNNKIKLAATLAEQEALLNSINAQFLLSITDKKGIIQSVNEPFCLFSGYSHEELVGASHSIVNSGFHPKEFWGEVWRHISSGKPWRGEVCNRNKQGEIFWLDTAIAPILNSEGTIERFIALRSDITARKAAELARTQMSHLLTSVLDAASEVGVIATDAHGLITVFNSGAERLLGYSAAEMVGKQTPAIIHLPEEVIARGYELSEGAGEVIEGFEVFVHIPRLVGAETRRWTYVRKDSSHVPVSLTATAIRDMNGTIEGYLGIAMDISEQLASQAQLRAITEQLLQAAAVANLGIWTWSLGDNSLHWNDQMFELYQQDPNLGVTGQLAYQHWRERVHPEDIACIERALQKAMDGEEEFNVLARLCMPDGTVRYTKAIAQVLRDASGAPFSMTGVNIDITEHFLQEETLRVARDLAQEANLAKSQFLANMSHEIRTPMNAILGMLQLLQTTGLTGRQIDYSHNAINAAQSLLGLLNDVLDFSKIEAGKLQLDVHEFSLQQLLNDVQIVLTGIQGTKRQVEILFDIGRDIPLNVVADKLRLQQILINLTSNALKFTERGFVKLSIALRARDKNAIKLEVRVEDTGIGIALEHQQKIFEGFTQAEASTTRRFGGTGLGLVICQRLLALMNSTLNLTSTPGFGSQFWFSITLPLGQAHEINQPSVQFEQVLLVEDNAQARALYALDLADWVAHINTAVSGREAVELIQKKSIEAIDLLIIDWAMSEQNGFVTALAIKQLLAEKMPPLVFMVLNEDRETLYEQCKAANIHPAGVILKPIIPWHWGNLFQTLQGSVQAHSPVQSANSEIAVLNGLNLLVVEDNDLNRQVAEGLLTHLGAQVDLAFSGVDAVTKLIEQKLQYDLVFMDMQMPLMDGLQATRRLREEPSLAKLPIVAMTANVSPADVQACLAAGMNDHVGKPLDIQQMLKVMGRYVSLASEPGKPSAPAALPSAVTEAWETILLRFGKNIKLIRRATSQFASELERQLALLRSAVEAQDSETQARCFHSVKGVAATVGASKLAKWCADKEKAVKAGSAANTRQIEEFVQLSQEAVEHIGQLIEINLGPSA